LKHLLNKTLTVKQLIALIILPLAILATIIVFSIGDTNVALLTKGSANDSTDVALAPADTKGLGKLLSYVDSLNNADQLFGGSWSFCLMDADSGKSMCNVNIDRVKAIKELGIDSIAGCIIGDAQAGDQDPIPVGWTWEDIQSDYGTGPSGLNIRENVYDILLKGSKGGVSLRTNPQIPGLKLHNQVVSNPKIAKSYAYVQGAPFQFERTVFGEVADTLRERSAIPDPALFCAQLLKTSLIANGIRMKDSATTTRLIRLNNIKSDSKETKKTIVTSLSPSLEDLVYHTNQISQNFYAESILRAISMNENGYGSGPSSVGIIYKFWKNKGLDLRGMCMVDGCGLSRMNNITTHQLVEMLRVFSKDPNVFPAFYKSLSVAGESGTMRKLSHGTLAEGNLHAKSGTMSRVKSYTGYVKTKNGKLLCFAMIGNNTLWTEVELKYKFEKLFELMAELP